MRLLHLALALTLGTALYADVITLKSGRVINGTYLGGNARQVRVEVGDQIETYDVTDLARIEFGGPHSSPRSAEDRPVMRRPDPPPPPPVNDRPTVRRDTAIMRPDAEPSVSSPPPPPPAQASAGNIQLPAGTNLVIRMIDGVDSEKNSVGQTFTASLDEPVMLNGQTVIPRGADAVVKLVDAKDSGKFTGRAELTLSLQSVKVGGQSFDINTQSVTRESDARGQKTARNAGIGAVAGTVIGAIAGGGKGAAIGAAAGGAAGAGTQVITKGQQVKIPSETRLTFVLDNAVTI